MTGRTSKGRTPAAGDADADAPVQPAPRRHWVFMTALWEVVVTMGTAFVPLPVEYDDDSHDTRWSDTQ
jgi:hypothetical protein